MQKAACSSSAPGEAEELRMFPASACLLEHTLAAQGGHEAFCQLYVHILVLSVLWISFSLLENPCCLLFRALYSGSTHSRLWGSLLPEASDPEASEDTITSNDLGVGVSVWSWLCHLLTVSLWASDI